MPNVGLVVVKSNAELEREEAAEVQAQREAEERQQAALESSLAGHIRQFWEVAYRHKEPIEQRMLKNLRQIAGQYSDDKLEKIKQAGLPAIYMAITATKCRAAKSWIRDVLMPAGDRPWQLNPTRVPELNPEIKLRLMQKVQADALQMMAATGQEIGPDQMRAAYDKLEALIKKQQRDDAETKCERMADEIEDQLIEGGWDQHFDDVLSDVVDFPAGILKAPVLRRKKKLAWSAQGQSVEVVESIAPEVYRVDPFAFYPAPGAVEPDDGDCIEVHEYQADQIHDLIGLPGYDEGKIRAVLRDHTLHGLSNWTREALRSAKNRARGQFNGHHSDEKTIEALEFWGSVQGRKLLEWGKSAEEIQDPDALYDVMAVLIGQHVVCVRLNPDPLGRKPYHKACFENIPGAFWGKGVPDLIEDCQDVCNASARALVANMGIASGPQVAVNTQSLPPGADIEQMYPWKIWQLDFSKTGGNSRPPIDFFQPNGNTSELMNVFKEFSSLADEYSGIPAYSYGVGQSVGGAGKTASGLSMLMNAASKSIKNVIKHIDSGVIAPAVEKFYVHNMLWHEDQSLKGDAQVVARGALSLVAKEQNQLRLQDMLAQTANPLDMQILGLEGRAELLRKAFHGVDIGSEFVPSEEELRAKQQQLQQQEQLQAQGGAPQ
ncbi:hypothetical protein [Marinobacter sp.]|uniref:portal protein n=1 Tax=Marinobacter sp. TaxID=50741 RepID=UPI003A921DFF